MFQSFNFSFDLSNLKQSQMGQARTDGSERKIDLFLQIKSTFKHVEAENPSVLNAVAFLNFLIIKKSKILVWKKLLRGQIGKAFSGALKNMLM